MTVFVPIRIREQEKRFIRLQTYFAPYSFLRLAFDPTVDLPVYIKPSRSKQKRKYLVRVSSSLLDNDSPEWVEPTILSYVKEYIREYERSDLGPSEFSLHSPHFEELEKIILRKQEDLINATWHIDDDGNRRSIGEIWAKLSVEYFPEQSELRSYEVIWTDRNQSSSLASCNCGRKRIEVAKALDNDECYPYLEPLLYHEMCHAVLGQPEPVKGRRMWHGREFQDHEARHPLTAELNRWIEAGGWDEAVEAAKERKKG